MTSFLRNALAILVVTLTTTAASSQDYAPYPQPDNGYVTDLADVLTDRQEERLEQWLIQTEDGTKTEIIVVTIPSMRSYPGSSNTSIEEFATGLFNKWGIGNHPKNDGILMLVSVGDRKARIELGAGHVAARDAEASRIMQNTIVPEFRNGNYADGIEKGVKEVIATFTDYRVGVNWPVVIYPALILAAVIVATELFPFEPTTWTWAKRFCGRPSSSVSRRIRSRPKFQPIGSRLASQPDGSARGSTTDG